MRDDCKDCTDRRLILPVSNQPRNFRWDTNSQWFSDSRDLHRRCKIPDCAAYLPVEQMTNAGLGFCTAIKADIMPPEDRASTGEQTATILREWLRGFLPVDKLVVESMRDTLDDLRRELLPLSGKPLGDVVVDSAISVAVLNRIKDYGKRLAAQGRSRADHDAALTIYFAAIASALVFHGQKISTHPHESLERSFVVLVAKPWMVPELVELFTKARQVCHERIRKDS